MNSISFSPFIRAVVCLVLLVLFANVSAYAQQQSTDGATPLGLSPGAPSGSYPLSDFEDVNLFNGTLNFALPLVKIDGRGSAGYPLILRVDHKWLVQKEQAEGQPPINIYTPQPAWWTDLGWAPIYSIGRMEMRQGGTRDYVLGSGGCGYIHRQTLTRLTFTAPDGTEYELRDQSTNGQPVNATCTAYNRGTTFVTADGTAATFISDSNIFDYQYDNPANAPPSGYMMLKDGTRYRVDGGKVTWMRDANGNKLTFNYDIYQRMTAVTDSLNRQVTISPNTGAGSYDQITFKGFGGATRTIKVYFASLSTVLRSDFTLLTTAQMFPELNGAGGGSYNASVVSAVELPNGKQYQFRYNSYAELSRVILPTGGAIEYDYAAGLSDSATGSGVVSGLAEKQIYRRVIERRVYPDGGSGSGYASRMTYSRPETSSTNAGYVTTDQYNSSGALLTRAIHYFYGSARESLFKQPTEYPAWTDSREYKTETYAANGTTLLRKVEHTFQQRAAVSWWTAGSSTAPPNDVRLTETVTTLSDTNQVSKQTFGYDDTVPYNNQNNLKEYDYGSGTFGSLVRETRTTYLTGSTYTGTSVHIRNLPTQVSTYDGSGVERARTTYEYDNYATDTNHALLTDRSNISGFDSAFNTSYTTRGNNTGTTNYFLSAGAVTGSLSSYSQYDIAGNVIKTIDPRGYATELKYADCYGAPNGEARTNSAPTELSGVSGYALVTSVKNSLNQWTYSQYDFYLDQPVDGEDVNGVVSSGTYNDSLDRPTQIRRAAGTAITNQTTFSYDDTNRIITTFRDRDANNDSLLVNSVVYDPMGRSIETRQYEDGTNYIATQSQYDVLGRLYKTSNPFRPYLSETAVWTTTAFDTLGRPTSVTLPDSAATSTSYSGNSVTIVDQANRKKKSVTDALGRLKQVYEDPDTLNYVTSYEYDVLDGLTSVTQGTQTRTFVYDSLKRLTSGTNPENGTVSYQYDSSSNLLVKTDARGVSTHLAYDALNRLTRRWYNGSSLTSATTHNSPALPSGVGTSDEANFYYDSQSLPTGAPTFSRGSSVGRQVAVTYGSGNSTGDYFGYDALGQAVLKIQQTGSVNYQTTASYNLAGSTTSTVYPSGHTVNNAYDAAGRTSSVTGNLGDGTSRNYATNLSYSPFGGISREQFGTNTPLYHKSFYNIRGQIFDTRLSSVNDTWDWNRGRLIQYYSSNHLWGQSGTDNTGNVRFAETWIPPENATLDQADTLIEDSYSYDALNRVTNVSEQRMNASGGWVWQQQLVQQYTYDRYGNRTINGAQTWGTGVNNKVFTADTATNRLGVPGGQSGAMSYDSAGNLTNDTYSGAGNRTYDAESKITSAWGGNNQAQLYTYDANGHRVKRTIDGVATWQVYGLGGELLAEYAASGSPSSPKKEYGYRNAQLLVTAEPAAGQSTQNASWTNAVGVSVSGNNLTKTAADNWANGGAASSQAITSGDGYVEITASETNTFRMVGLSNGDSNQDYTDIDFAAYLATANLCIYEAGVSRGCVSTFTTGDVIRIAVESGVVKYKKNGAVVYTSSVTPTYPLLADTAFWSNGSTINNAVISGNLNGGGGAGGVRWLVADQLGTPRMIVDQTGTLANLKRHDYLPFGEELFAGAGGRTTALGYASGDGVRQQFTSKERDVETGLDYFDARYYSPVQGRFISADEFTGGPDEFYEFHDLASQNPTFYADLTDPQSLNKYQYGYNNPLLYVDPDGHQGIREWARRQVRSAATTVMNTVEGAASAYAEDNGLSGTTGPQNRVGRGIGHTVAAVQGSFEIYMGVSAVIGGGTEAGATLPACATGVGCAAPAVGGVVAVGGAVTAIHGTYVLGNTIKNVFKSTNNGGNNGGNGNADNSSDRPNTKPKDGHPGTDKTTVQGTQDKLDDMSKNQAAHRKHGTPHAMDSIEKTKQDFKNATRKIKSSKDLEEP
ncbi:MAG TPA: RHS repeat-associated core domain-containing protein [Pyrinomonadaceae bacterium]